MTFIKNIILMSISLVMSAVTFNLFIKNLNIVTGGVNGIALIINNLFDMDASITIFIQLFILMILSFIFLGFKKTTGSIISVFLYPFLVKTTSNFLDSINFSHSSYLVLSLVIGVLTGIANAIMYKTEFSNGGLPIISQILLKYKLIPIEISSFVINGIIVLVGGIYTGIKKLLYALLILYVNSVIIKKSKVLGNNNN